jgi:hypothetical protein
MCFLREEITKKNPVILLSRHSTVQEEDVQKRLGGNPQIKPHIITSYIKFMSSIDSSDMMLYAYLDERWTLCYWKKVAFSITFCTRKTTRDLAN